MAHQASSLARWLSGSLAGCAVSVTLLAGYYERIGRQTHSTHFANYYKILIAHYCNIYTVAGHLEPHARRHEPAVVVVMVVSNYDGITGISLMSVLAIV